MRINDSFRFFDQKSKALNIKLSYHIFRDESKLRAKSKIIEISREQELKDLIEKEMISFYNRYASMIFNKREQREIDDDALFLEQFIINSFMSKRDIQRNHDNFDFSKLE